MSDIKVVGQNIMDLFYQSYKTDEDFFDLSHFVYMAGIAYGKLIQEEYERQWKLNYQLEGIGFMEPPQDWLRVETVKIEKDDNGDYYAELSKRPFTFLFDTQGSGVYDVSAVGKNKCRTFIRIPISQKWMGCTMPNTGEVFWYSENGKIRFMSIPCKPEEVRVSYIPALDIDGEFDIPKSKEADILDYVLNRMIIARQGVVIDTTNDSNPNKVLANEINTKISKLGNVQ